jgi:hypothetical protein
MHKLYTMKTYIKIASVAVVFAFTATSCYVSQTVAQPAQQEVYDNTQQPEISFNVFYNELTPYGRWVDYPQYGRVWIAYESGFVPYQSSGHWIYTNYGWTWASNYNWGWAPFHYGRWDYDPFYGWFWVPGYEWAPAWVSWRSGGGYYGWAPLSPGISISIGASFGNIPGERWCFVPNRYMGFSNINNYYLNRSNNVTVINNTTIINNTNEYRGSRYLQGPDRRDVERNIGRPLQTVQVRDANRPGQEVGNNNFTVYRPRVNRNDNNVGRPDNNQNPPRPVERDDRRPNTPSQAQPDNTNPARPPERPVVTPIPVNPTPAPNRPKEPDRRPSVPTLQPQQPNNSSPVRPERPDLPVRPQPEPRRPIMQDPSRPERGSVVTHNQPMPQRPQPQQQRPIMQTQQQRPAPQQNRPQPQGRRDSGRPGRN